MSESPPLAPPSTLRTELRRAYLLLDAGELALARATLERATQHHPDEPLAHALRGSVELAAGEIAAAIKLLRPVARKWPEHPAAHVYLAEAHLLTRRAGQAKRALLKARESSEAAEGSTWQAHIDALETLIEELDVSAIPEPLLSRDDPSDESDSSHNGKGS